ncbi:MAG: hypothetical protein AAFP19_22030 [Bacteroidota bacterium]
MFNAIFAQIILMLTCFSPANDIAPPAQPTQGPGGADYQHESVRQSDFAEEEDGYWLYEPAEPRPEKAPVIVFTHGYGAYNPMIYGGWIKHLVRKGNIVIFPRYQKNLWVPAPDFFVGNAAKGIRDALIQLDTGDHVKPVLEGLSLVGHSYGGVISANLAVNFDTLGIPKPVSVFLCSPGSGPFSGGVLDSYEAMPSDMQLLMMVSENDHVVGDRLANHIFKTATQVEKRNLIRQYEDTHGKPKIQAGHNESYYLDKELDSGLRNMSARRALKVASKDAVDYYAYWKLYDALLDCSRNSQSCHIAFGNSLQQRFMGYWSDGTAVRELEVETPNTVLSEKH